MSKSARKISVLMPSFNYARYLPQAIEGVLSQSYRDLELIIVDDCSTDGSKEICEEFRRADDRVITIFHNENRQAAGARNSGLGVSAGDLIAFCDADDVWAPGKLDAQLERFRDEPQAGVVHTDAVIADSDGRQTGQRFSTTFHSHEQKRFGMLFNEFCLRNFVCNSSVLLRRECLEFAGGFTPGVQGLEDWICWARISRKYSFAYVRDPLVTYRIHLASLSRQLRAMANSRIAAVTLLLREYGDISPALKAKMLYSVGMSHKDLGDQRAALEAFRSSVRADMSSLRGWARCGQSLLGRLKRTETDVWKGNTTF